MCRFTYIQIHRNVSYILNVLYPKRYRFLGDYTISAGKNDYECIGIVFFPNAIKNRFNEFFHYFVSELSGERYYRSQHIVIS